MRGPLLLILHHAVLESSAGAGAKELASPIPLDPRPPSSRPGGLTPNNSVEDIRERPHHEIKNTKPIRTYISQL